MLEGFEWPVKKLQNEHRASNRDAETKVTLTIKLLKIITSDCLLIKLIIQCEITTNLMRIFTIYSFISCSAVFLLTFLSLLNKPQS